MRVLTILLLLVAGLVAGCGGDHGGHGGGGGGSGEGASSGEANAVDRAFVRLMVPHHESALEMAELAQAQAQHREIKSLAGDIDRTQQAEIDEMTTIADSVGVELAAEHGAQHGEGHAMGDPEDLETLGLDAHGAGMAMAPDALDGARPFDRAFIDEMVPHHEGAVRMAEVELARGKHPELKALAKRIVAAQEREIEQMSSWREAWYGSPPAGG